MTTALVTAVGLSDVSRFFDAQPDIAREALRIAINQTVRRGGLKLLRHDVRAQIAFPAGYLESDDRLHVSKLAQNADLEAIIEARARATSLARFALDRSAVTGQRRGGVRVQVNPGSTRMMPQAFLMRLRRGASLTEDNYNLGLAIRLQPGEQILNKRDNSVQLGHNLYLLYAPSVDQVFRSVADEDAEQVGDMATDEFFRQWDRLAGDRRYA